MSYYGDLFKLYQQQSMQNPMLQMGNQMFAQQQPVYAGEGFGKNFLAQVAPAVIGALGRYVGQQQNQRIASALAGVRGLPEEERAQALIDQGLPEYAMLIDSDLQERKVKQDEKRSDWELEKQYKLDPADKLARDQMAMQSEQFGRRMGLEERQLEGLLSDYRSRSALAEAERQYYAQKGSIEQQEAERRQGLLRQFLGGQQGGIDGAPSAPAQGGPSLEQKALAAAIAGEGKIADVFGKMLNERRLITDFLSSQYDKEFNALNLNETISRRNAMVKAIDDPSGGGDVDFIFNLPKTMDGNSAVMKDERGLYQVAENLPAWLSGPLRKAVNELNANGAISRNTKISLMGPVDRLINEQISQMRRNEQDFADRAAIRGVDPSAWKRTLPDLSPVPEMEGLSRQVAPTTPFFEELDGRNTVRVGGKLLQRKPGR